ncbi:MAG: IS5/IS1182 family transposase, partial [Anaerolineae bacterium]|nr:IS5/IS1182 family transposase [Anaerolineae bacterium]
VRPADVPEGEGGRELLRQAVEAGRLRQVAVVWAEGGYAGGFEAWVRERLGWRVEVVRRRGRAFAVLPRRWVVERTFAWLGWYRRLSKDYEFVLERSVSWIGDGAHRRA